MRIAIVEDDKDQAMWLETWLKDAGHDCHLFFDGNSAIKALQRESFDLVVLDWILPDVGGDEVLTWARKNLDWQIPVIFTTQRDEEKDIVYALEHGADDYLVKPIKPLELKARIMALSRRVTSAPREKLMAIPPYEIDMDRRTISIADQEVDLTQKEYELALFLFTHQGRLLSRAHLLESVWRHASEINTRTLDTHISRLRKKLGFNTSTGWKLASIYHQGYRLEPPAEEPPVDLKSHI